MASTSSDRTEPAVADSVTAAANSTAFSTGRV
jgi:hypothetical protein